MRAKGSSFNGEEEKVEIGAYDDDADPNEPSMGCRPFSEPPPELTAAALDDPEVAASDDDDEPISEAEILQEDQVGVDQEKELDEDEFDQSKSRETTKTRRGAEIESDEPETKKRSSRLFTIGMVLLAIFLVLALMYGAAITAIILTREDKSTEGACGSPTFSAGGIFQDPNSDLTTPAPAPSGPSGPPTFSSAPNRILPTNALQLTSSPSRLPSSLPPVRLPTTPPVRVPTIPPTRSPVRLPTTRPTTLDYTIEREALIAIHAASGGNTWSNINARNTWLRRVDHCDWQGVGCSNSYSDSGSRKVTSLQLPDVGMTGSLAAASLLLLPSLTTLDFSQNNLAGPIPTELGLLTAMQYMRLGENDFTGTVPVGICSLSLYTLEADCGGDEPLVTCDCCTTCAVKETPVVQREALVALYNSTNGDSWVRNVNWLVGDPCVDSWVGVGCGSEKNVVTLDLDSNGLSGSLASQIGSLSKLTSLEMANNGIGGSIPSEIALLAELRYLMLSDNLITGDLPTEMGSFSSIQTIDFENNTIGGDLPSEFGSLATLNSLNLGTNNLTGTVGQDICILRRGSLSTLVMDCAGSDPEIECLCCTVCAVDKTPEVQIEALRAFYNSTGGENWRSLYSSGNDWLQGDPCANAWRGVQCDKEKDITGINLNDKRLTGTLPSEIGLLTGLKFIDLVNNNLRGMLPSEIAGLSRLTSLDLSNNVLSGNVTSHLGRLGDLVILNLHNNSFMNEIPTELGALKRLNMLDLSENDLVGDMPSVICFLDLNTLAADCAGMDAQVTCLCCTRCYADTTPPEQVRALKLLHTQTNGPSWNFAHQYQDCWLMGDPCIEGWQGITCDYEKRITGLNLAQIGMRGPLPTEIGLLTDLFYLRLSENTLTGTMPTEIAQLVKLTDLDLQSNVLSSSIPTEIPSMQQLSSLQLSYNLLTGTVPSSFGEMTSLYTFTLHGNSIVGTMPSTICAQKDERYSSFGTLTADCNGNPPKIECDCCTSCYPN